MVNTRGASCRACTTHYDRAFPNLRGVCLPGPQSQIHAGRLSPKWMNPPPEGRRGVRSFAYAGWRGSSGSNCVWGSTWRAVHFFAHIVWVYQGGHPHVTHPGYREPV